MTVKELLHELADGRIGKKLEGIRIPLPFGFAAYPFDSTPIFSTGYHSNTSGQTTYTEATDSDFTSWYRGLDEGSKTKALDYLFRKDGLNINYTTFDDLTGRYGKGEKNIYAWRIGDSAEIGVDGPLEFTRALLFHEYEAGTNHERSDLEAQARAKKKAKYLGDHKAYAALEWIDTNVFGFN